MGDKVTGGGWFEDHVHANIVWDMAAVVDPVEPEPEPEPEPDDGELLTTLYEIASLIDEAISLVGT